MGERGADENPIALLRRGFGQFLSVPTLVLLGFLLLSVATLALDRIHPAFLEPFRQFISASLFSNPDSAARLLATVATTVVTVTSITFSVVLISLQQSASTMSTQVFDQFVRRRRNQIFFGFFLGVGLYALVILAAVHPQFTPTYGALLTLVLTGVALALIPIVIYAALDEMRPRSIIAAIRDHALSAHDAQREMIRRTRRTARANGTGVEIRSARVGFVDRIDVARLGELTRAQGDSGAEFELTVRMGSFVAWDEVLGVLRGGQPDVDQDAFRACISIAGDRDMARDPNYALAQLETIAWTSASSSKQNPQPAILVVRYLRDLIRRWAAQRQDEVAADPDVEPVVYDDALLRVAVGTLGSISVAASEGMQHQTAAEIYRTFGSIYSRLGEPLRAHTQEVLVRSLSALADHVLTLELQDALDELVIALENAQAPQAARLVRTAEQRMVAGSRLLSARGKRPGEA